MSLLEADVNFRVVKDFVERVKERSIGSDVMQSLTPDSRLSRLFTRNSLLYLARRSNSDLEGTATRVMMLAGLQGSGKTTTAAKLALFAETATATTARCSGHLPSCGR